jgi:16S rRNA (guanine527-N7)-methyltransferase
VTDVSRETEALLVRYADVPGMVEFADILVTQGVERGLIGPREVSRIWPRHLANCAVVAEEALEQIPAGSHIADVGSGAGLPGVVWALVRPDVTVTLIEPLLRRSTFLTQAVSELGLAERVSVVRARAEEVTGRYDVVTARAVARLTQLVGWTLPLTRVGGWVVALKGVSAADEAAEAGPQITRLGGGAAQVVEYGAGILQAPTTVVLIPRVSGGGRRTR